MLGVPNTGQQGCGKWNPRICDTTKRAAQSLIPRKKRDTLAIVTEVVGAKP